jgi:hypothetical protein
MANKRMAKKAAKKAEMKAAEAKKVVTKKVEPKTIEIKPIEKVEEVAVEVKEAVVEEVKEEKPKAKRTRKVNIKTSIVVQAHDREVSMEEAIERATEDWCKSGNDRTDLKEIAVYVKPEEAAIFYVINGKATGRVAF